MWLNQDLHTNGTHRSDRTSPNHVLKDYVSPHHSVAECVQTDTPRHRYYPIKQAGERACIYARTRMEVEGRGG